MKVRKVKYVKSAVDNYLIFTNHRRTAREILEPINKYINNRRVYAYTIQFSFYELLTPVKRGMSNQLHGKYMESQNIHCTT
jgi:hypothetical protein